MTTELDILNRALISAGIQKTIASAAQDSVEAKTFAATYANLRDSLLRMAPWDCAVKVANAIYITSVPGTPENTSTATNNWQPGQPAPPWAYEYWYPDDCLRACYIIPAQQTGFADGVPITTAVTGGAPAFWQGQPVKFKVATDQFREASGAITIVSGGTGYQVNDTIIFGVDVQNQNFNAGDVPAGIINAKVTSVSSGVITAATLQAFTNLNKTSLLFSVPTYTLLQVSTSGIGTGATATVAAVGQNQFDARIILTNQEFASLSYVKQVTDPNVFDPLFIEALTQVNAANLVYVLTQDKNQANALVAKANDMISQARKVDGNEGLTVNDVTPDFIRVRGIAWTEYYTGPYSQYDWGSYWPVY